MGCSVDSHADRVNAEDKYVMRAMVEISCKLGADRLVVSDRPAVPRQTARLMGDGPGIRFGIDVNQRIAREARWPAGPICPVVRVVADSTIEAVLAKDSESWQNFIATFDGARSLMRISLPVYSSDGKHAVVYTTGDCPYTCGAGFFHELEKTHSGWRISSSVTAWTS